MKDIPVMKHTGDCYKENKCQAMPMSTLVRRERKKEKKNKKRKREKKE